MENWCTQRTINKELSYVMDLGEDIARIYTVRAKRAKVGCCILSGKWARSFAEMLTMNEFMEYSSLVFDVDVGEGVNDKENKDS